MNTQSVKQPASFHGSSYVLKEYMLIMIPDRHVDQKLLMAKQDFQKQYGDKNAIKTKPHITVASFLAKEAMEDTLNRWINNICNQHRSFGITIDNYSGFPPDTIYLRIQDPLPVYSLIRQLRILDDFIQASDCPPLKASPKPHLTVVSQLSTEVYDRAIKEYAGKYFHESFMVEELHLLRRNHQFDTFVTVNKFRFAPGL